jgi:AcrR family transcriptional regulator
MFVNKRVPRKKAISPAEKAGSHSNVREASHLRGDTRASAKKDSHSPPLHLGTMPGSQTLRPLGDRRVPTQERSRKRFERILDAAALVFSSQGHEAATMEAVAAKADTSIGSIYQFFPNKGAVFDALVRRYHDTLRVFLDGLLGGPILEMPLVEIIDTTIDALTTLHQTDPGFRAVWVGMHLTENVVAEGEALNRELAERVANLFGGKLPKLAPKKRLFVATMVVELVSAMLIVSARRRSPEEGQAVMDETKKLLRLYLAPFLDAEDDEEDDGQIKAKGKRRKRIG